MGSISSNPDIELQTEILRLKKNKNAVILAHYYQEIEIQQIADYVGDSLGLSQQAAQTDADIIVFAGVHFMAETAKILNPGKTVLLPEMRAGCSLADSCPPEKFRSFIEDHRDHVVITYINCSAEIKAMSDIICTSANAELIVRSVPEYQPIIFAPDRNLGNYLVRKTGREMKLWDGVCDVHEAFSMEKLHVLRSSYPDALLIAHPESDTPVLESADYIGSTTGMLQFVRNTEAQKIIVATEAGILFRMRAENPDKILIPAPAREDNTCACSECAFMKMNTLQKLYDCLNTGSPEIFLKEEIRRRAMVPLERMFTITNSLNVSSRQ